MYKNIYYYLYHSLNFIIYYIHIYVFSFLRSMRCSICWIEQQSPIRVFNTRTCFCHGSSILCFFPSCFLIFFFFLFFLLENLFHKKILLDCYFVLKIIYLLIIIFPFFSFFCFLFSLLNVNVIRVFCTTIYHSCLPVSRTLSLSR